MDKPTVALVSSSNFLSLNILENLLSKNCRVVVFASDTSKWLEKTKHISNKVNLEILNEKYIPNYGAVNYAIFCQGLIAKDDLYGNFKRRYQWFFQKNVKSIATFPFELFDVKENTKLPLNGNLALVYIGDLMGPRIDLDSKLLLPTNIDKSVRRRELSLAVGEVFYPLFVSDVSREIVKWIFSFGPYGKETFLMGPTTSASTFWKEVLKVVPNLRVHYENGLPSRVLPRGYEIKRLPINLSFALKETLRWALARSKFSGKRVNINSLPRQTKRVKLLLAIIIPILLFPFLCLAINAGLFYLSFRNFVKGNSESATNTLLFSKTVSFVGREESRVLSYIPLFGIPYRESFFALNLTLEGADIGVNGVALADSSKELFDKALGDEIFDPENLTRDVKLNLDSIYQKISFLEGDTKNQGAKGGMLAKKVLKNFDFERIKKVSFEGTKFIDNLSEILGKNERKSYLVLFQNNMELRPTGGFIGSFGILTFEGGRLTDFGVSDVYSADGQLRGHIEPPGPIKKYLGEANWYLRDSNWDPDFPTSARRAEWFLDKEIDRQVEGVISVDLYPVSQILKYTGPMYLADYNMDITAENLYEKTQAEVQDEFFPGTHKKASFLTALSRNLVTEIPKLKSGAKFGILKEFYKSLESRHIQAYLHDETAQNSLSNLGWSGEVITPTCEGNCYSDLVGVVEANVGVNKANYFISRSETLRVDINSNEIKRELTLNLKNSANTALGISGKYVSYIRILVPENVELESLFDVVGEEAKNVTPEIYEVKGRREIGFITEVLGETSKKLIVTWKDRNDLGVSGQGDYKLYVRKQAGTSNEDTVSVVINGQVSYNSTLAKDIWLQNP